MSAADRIRQELNYMEPADNEIDQWYQERLKEVLPHVFLLLADGGLLDNQVVCTTTMEIIERLMNHRPLSKLHSMEERPDEWEDFSKESGEPFFQNKRYGGLFTKGDGEYFDIDSDLYEYLPAGITFHGNLITNGAQSYFSKYAKIHLRSVMAGMDHFVKMPYYPSNERSIHEVNWYDMVRCETINATAILLDEAKKKDVSVTFNLDVDDAPKVTHILPFILVVKELRKMIMVLRFMLNDGSSKIAAYVDPYEYDMNDPDDDCDRVFDESYDIWNDVMDELQEYIEGTRSVKPLFLITLDEDGQTWFVTEDMFGFDFTDIEVPRNINRISNMPEHFTPILLSPTDGEIPIIDYTEIWDELHPHDCDPSDPVFQVLDNNIIIAEDVAIVAERLPEYGMLESILTHLKKVEDCRKERSARHIVNGPARATDDDPVVEPSEPTEPVDAMAPTPAE